MRTHIVIDTSYWLELFKVPGRYKDEYHIKIKQLFSRACKNKYRLYLPIPVLFELANHIAHIGNGNKRLSLARKFSDTVKSGVSISEPYLNIIPNKTFCVANEVDENLSYFVERFELEFVQQGLGFTDSAIILEAQSLKDSHNKVHIWTLDGALKSREPDNENGAFVGN